jgi:type IV pilus assembly protein PilW
LIILLGVIRVFSNSKQGYRIQESSQRLQESGRFALEHLSHYVRLADFWGSSKATQIESHATAYAGPGSCNNAWILDVTNALVGYDGGTVSPLPSGCLANGDYVPNSDILVVRSANPDVYIKTNNLTTGQATNNAVNGRIYLRNRRGGRSILFDATNAAHLTHVKTQIASVNTSVDDGAEGIFNYQYMVSGFFIRTCGDRAGSATTCTNAADGGRPKPNLCYLHLTSAQLQQDCLVEGIEMMKFEYGLDLNDTANSGNPDFAVDTYRPASAIAPNQWSRVLTVRMAVMARSDKQDPAFLDTGSYPMTSNFSYTPGTETFASANEVRRYPRRLFIKEIQVRNRTRI